MQHRIRNSTLRTARALNNPYESDELNSPLQTARALNNPYESNKLNLPLADCYSAGVLDMGELVRSTFKAEEAIPALARFHAGPLSWLNSNFAMLVFVERGKPENLE